MDSSMPGSPVLHYLLKFAQIHWISDAIQPSHLQSPTSPPALNQGHWFSIFPSIRVFPNEFSLCIRWPKYWSFSISPSMNIHGWFSLGSTDLISLLSKGFSRVFSSITIQKHQFFSPQPSLWTNSHIYYSLPLFWPHHPDIWPEIKDGDHWQWRLSLYTKQLLPRPREKIQLHTWKLSLFLSISAQVEPPIFVKDHVSCHILQCSAWQPQSSLAQPFL